MKICNTDISFCTQINKEGCMTTKTKLDAINKRIEIHTKKRDALLRELRKKCKHLKLVEFKDVPPRRICVDCGAEEEGWYCGYHVLVMAGDTQDTPHKSERAIVKQASNFSEFYFYRQDGPSYFVGQNHPNFAGGGKKTYKQLTEVTE